MITNLDDIPYVFDCKKLAEIMGVSTFTARNIMNSDGFPLRVYGPRSHRIWKAEFLRWMEGERFDATHLQA